MDEGQLCRAGRNEGTVPCAVAGAIAAVAGTVVPATILMLILIVFFFGFKDDPNLQAMLKAVRPVVVGLLMWTAYTMAYTIFNVSSGGWSAGLLGNWDKVIIALVAFALLTVTEINPVWLVLAAAAFGFVVYR